MGGGGARNRRFRRNKHLDSDLLITSHLEAGEALRRLLLLLLVLCVGAHLGVKWPVFLSLSFLNLSAV